MAKEIKDIAASINARLINLAKENREEAQSVLIRYGVERFLYRLGRSEHKDKFLLKGASVLFCDCQKRARWADPTAGIGRGIVAKRFGSVHNLVIAAMTLLLIQEESQSGHLQQMV